MILTLETSEGGFKKLSVPNPNRPGGIIAFDTDCTILYEAKNFAEMVEQIRNDGWERIEVKDAGATSSTKTVSLMK